MAKRIHKREWRMDAIHDHSDVLCSGNIDCIADDRNQVFTKLMSQEKPNLALSLRLLHLFYGYLNTLVMLPIFLITTLQNR